jgi:hypothetical protein
MNSKMSGRLEIAGSVALAIAAEPIHEAGHAIAVRIVTGIWPEIGFWAVHPTAAFHSNGDILAVLGAGDAAVTIWWGLMLIITYRRPDRKWLLIGPTFVVGLALMNWLAAALLSLFGYGYLGASDAAKFIEVSGLAPAAIAAVLTGIIALIGMAVARIFGSGTHVSPAL